MSEFQPTTTTFRQGSRTLPGPYYVWEAILAEENEKIFAQAWHCVGRTARVSEPGQYFLSTIAGESVIVLRDRKGTLRAFANDMFGDGARVRFRPDFFPFVEPGVDYAISTPKLFDGKWVELGGAGMIHAKILERYGIDTDRYSGWAFGLGVERIPMMAYGIDDLRYFMENDLRFLEQFA